MPIVSRQFLFFLLCVTLFCSNPLFAAEFQILELTTKRQEDVYQLQAKIDYQLSDAALEALDNGVPLTFDIHVQVQRESSWVWTIWEERALDLHRRYLIRFRPLTKLYQVVDLKQGRKSSFVTREAALSALGEIDDVPLLSVKELLPDEQYLVKLKASLDIEALPLPLRPMAYMSSSWKLSSHWESAPLESSP